MQSQTSVDVGRRIVLRHEARKRAGGISRSTEQRLLNNDPTWPRPRQVTAGLTGYYEDELARWIEARPERGEVGLE